jgi:hypothetical protein
MTFNMFSALKRDGSLKGIKLTLLSSI